MNGSTQLTPWFFADASTQPLEILKYAEGTEFGRSILAGSTIAETQQASAKSYKKSLLTGIVQTYWDGKAPSVAYYR
jgi:hypothetical protein